MPKLNYCAVTVSAKPDDAVGTLKLLVDAARDSNVDVVAATALLPSNKVVCRDSVGAPPANGTPETAPPPATSERDRLLVRLARGNRG